VTRVVVVGNGVSGFACAKRLAELGADVTMIGPGLPYDRPPLSKRALEAGRAPMLADAAALVALGVHHADGSAEDFDPGAGTIGFRPSRGGERLTIRAERFVWATGLRPAVPPIDGIRHAICGATATGMEQLAARLSIPGKSVVVVGGGLIGSETAATLSRRHRVTLVDVAERPLARFHSAIGRAAAAALVDAAVTFLGGCQVEAIDQGAVLTATHGRIAADVVVNAAGVRTSLPAELACPPQATLDCDETLRVIGHETLWACGDVVRFPHPRFGPIAIPHWDHARASGRHAAEAAMGNPAPYVRDPYWFSDIARLRIQQVGVSEAAVEWRSHTGIHVGHDAAGHAACVVLLDAPHRLREARELVAA
jgi:3-phenylpropionate/trans-cinnamate dioxygenase ferredoxin reductase subunit